MKMTDEQIIAAIKEACVAYTVDGNAIIAIAEPELVEIVISDFRRLFGIQ